MNDLTTKDKCVILSKQECNLIDLLRKIKYGRVVVYLRDGQPVRAEESIKTIQF